MLQNKNEILSIDETFGEINTITLRNKDEGQVVRAFIIKCNEIHEDSLLKEVEIPFINLIRLYIHPMYRKLGWGTFIINRLIETYKNKPIIVDAFPDDESYMTSDNLIKFYMKLGFKILKPSEQGMFLIRN
jgi:ribosomal protein S18 acetylase RimI-like enzyme